MAPKVVLSKDDLAKLNEVVDIAAEGGNTQEKVRQLFGEDWRQDLEDQANDDTTSLIQRQRARVVSDTLNDLLAGPTPPRTPNVNDARREEAAELIRRVHDKTQRTPHEIQTMLSRAEIVAELAGTSLWAIAQRLGLTRFVVRFLQGRYASDGAKVR